ncbi:MAG TPA: hypothetical protein VJ804_02925 [Acidimicrobiales bacterium]|nr:hypothetical protein [Acidimicrobiales bacterium]
MADHSQIDDLALLDAAVTLTSRRVNVHVHDAYEVATGRAPTPQDAVELRMVVLRLERDGLVRSSADGFVEPTPDGRTAAELRRLERRTRLSPRRAG